LVLSFLEIKRWETRGRGKGNALPLGEGEDGGGGGGGLSWASQPRSGEKRSSFGVSMFPGWGDTEYNVSSFVSDGDHRGGRKDQQCSPRGGAGMRGKKGQSALGHLYLNRQRKVTLPRQGTIN